MPDMKDIVTDDMVKNALKSDAVTIAVKTQIKSPLDQQIDAAVDTALTDSLCCLRRALLCRRLQNRSGKYRYSGPYCES